MADTAAPSAVPSAAPGVSNLGLPPAHANNPNASILNNPNAARPPPPPPATGGVQADASVANETVNGPNGQPAATGVGRVSGSVDVGNQSTKLGPHASATIPGGVDTVGAHAEQKIGDSTTAKAAVSAPTDGGTTTATAAVEQQLGDNISAGRRRRCTDEWSRDVWVRAHRRQILSLSWCWRHCERGEESETDGNA